MTIYKLKWAWIFSHQIPVKKVVVTAFASFKIPRVGQVRERNVEAEKDSETRHGNCDPENVEVNMMKDGAKEKPKESQKLLRLESWSIIFYGNQKNGFNMF